MNRKGLTLFTYGRWLALALFVLAAGCFCSCGRRDGTALVVQAGEMEEAGAAVQEAAGSGAGSESVGSAGYGSQAENDAQTAVSGQSEAFGETAVPGEPAADGSCAEEKFSQQERCYVHVCGSVVRPGVYELSEGQRVYEAVELAGGFTEEAATAWLNLAETVYDGMKLEVPNREQAEQLAARYGVGIGADGSSGLGSLGLTGIGAGGSAGSTGTGAEPGGRININTATKEELMTLRGIGEARAEDIIRYREKNGGFRKIEDIMKVSGIKDAAFEKIKENITV